MKTNDAKIVTMANAAAQEIKKSEQPLKEALKKAVNAIELHEKALKGEREELDWGELHCDDAMNKGCITVDDPYGRPYAHFDMRKTGEKMLSDIIGALEARRLAEEKHGIKLGERGHSMEEWCEDAAKVWKHYYAPISELKQDVDKARIDVLNKVSELEKLYEQRMQLISLLSEEALAEIETATKLKELQGKNPTISMGVDAVIVPLESYEIPEDIKDLYAKVLAPVAHHDCCCYDDCDCDEYMDDEDEDEDECPW